MGVFLFSTFFKRHFLHEVLHDLLDWVSSCQGSQGSLTLYATLSLMSQFYMLLFYVPTILSTFEGRTSWQEHGENKRTDFHLSLSYLGKSQNLKLEKVSGPRTSKASKAMVKSLDFREGSDVFGFLPERDHFGCYLENELKENKQWEQSEQYRWC